MVQVGEIAYHVQGDVGGIGISRFRFTRTDSSPITPADCNTAAAAVKTLFSGPQAFIPSAIQWVCIPLVNTYDSASGLIQGAIPITSVPSTMTGTGTGNYASGVGMRINWKTSTIHGRRMLRGTTYLLPLSQNSYTGTGALQSGVTSNVQGAINNYLTSMATALLNAVVWHRPPKGTQAGGVVGIITGGLPGSNVAGLRSRRS